MKKVFLSIMITQCFTVGVVNAKLEDSATITVLPGDLTHACGIVATQSEAELNEYLEFEVTRTSSRFDPTVEITKWKMHEDGINPNNSYLENIAYKIPRRVKMADREYKKTDTFALKKRPNVFLKPGTKAAELTVTVTCYETPAEYKIYQSRWDDVGGESGFKNFNSTFGWNFKHNTNYIITNEKLIPE